MVLETHGTLYKIAPREEIVFADGSKHTKGTFAITMYGEFQRQVAFEVYGDDRLATLDALPIGTPLRVLFYAESRESKKNDKFYTVLRCLDFSPIDASQTAGARQPQATPTPISDTIPKMDDDEEVPF